jgi:hypothetical protein
MGVDIGYGFWVANGLLDKLADKAQRLEALLAKGS